MFCLIPGTDSELIPKDHGHILILKVEKLVNCSVLSVCTLILDCES